MNILKELMDEIIAHSCGVPIIFPVHPRTAKQLESLGISYPNLHTVEPLSYLEFNYLVERAKAVITDSGGITEETTVMNVPCMTLRDNTERPETIELGTNELLGVNPKAIGPAMAVALLTTLYGAMIANTIFMPLVIKLKGYSAYETTYREMIITGLQFISRGESPRNIQDQLVANLPPKEKQKLIESAAT